MGAGRQGSGFLADSAGWADPHKSRQLHVGVQKKNQARHGAT